MAETLNSSSVLCVPVSRLVRSGISSADIRENIVKIINVGGGAIEGDSCVAVMPDSGFQGGNVLRTNESIHEGGDFVALYQSARIGNFCYQFDSLPEGDYSVDFHFAEIININGPEGMRVFDVFVQEEKVVSELDIYSLVGANRPLQVADVRVTVERDGLLSIRFEGVNGSPIVSGICIKEATKLPASESSGNCSISNCYDIEKAKWLKCNAKCEKKLQELSDQYQRKTDECYQAWMSLTHLNKELEKVRVELDQKCFQTLCLDHTRILQDQKLKDLSSKYEQDKKIWIEAVGDLQMKVKIMKHEQSKLSREAHNCADSIPQLDKMVSAVQHLVAQCEDLKLKYIEEQTKRKKLYNQIQEAKGNIRVFCRCRPLNSKEILAGYATVVDLDAAKDGEIGIISGASAKKLYKFDRIYTPKDDQADVFADASPLVISVLDGYNVCIFAYGQTGTGKTFTMEGHEQNRGVNYRTLELLFEMVEQRKESFSYSISVNVLEVYNEQIRDLLANSPTSKKLEVRQASEGVHHVPGIVDAKVESISDAWNILQAGSNARAVGSNNVNEHSSRSHCMICIMVRAKNLINGECTNSKLWLVDLAGSERLAKTDVQGDRLKEAQNINRSLSALGDVVSALATKSSHIPYRNSKLTHLLQDSLAGDSKTLMFVQISPLETDVSETLSSLNFASRVRGVELGPAKKQVDMGELQKLKLLLDKAKQEAKSKDDDLQKFEDSVRSLELQVKSKDQFCKSQQEKVNELESQLGLKTEVCSKVERELLQLREQVKYKENTLFTLQQKVNELEKKLRQRDDHVNELERKLEEKEHVANELEKTLTEREDVECKALLNKVKETEKKLKERTQDFEIQSLILREKVKQLENDLEKSKEKEPPLHCQQLVVVEQSCSTGKPKPTSNESRVISAAETRRLKSSNRLNSQEESVLLKGTEPLSRLRRKWDTQLKGVENNILLSNPLAERKPLPIDITKGKHIDPSKAFARVTRTKSSVPVGTQRLASTRMNKEINSTEKNNLTRVWSR